jgi:hypothetical protein
MFAPIFACLILCGQQVVVTVDAKAAPDARATGRFTIMAGDANVGPQNPDFIILSRQVSRALAGRGFEEARPADDGDLVVVIDWMTGEPKKRIHHVGGDAGSPQVSGAAAGGRGGMPAGGSNNYAAFGMGMEATDAIELDYPQTFTLQAMDRAAFKADPKASPLWRMTLTSETTVADPAASGAPMIAAAIPYIARDTARTKVRLGSAEAPVKYIRGEIASLPLATPAK